MNLVDSSVWVCYYRPGNEEIKEVIKEAIRLDRVAVNGIIMVEILSGISKKEDFEKVKSDFGGFHILPMEERVFEKASELGSSLRKNGLTIPSTDLIIASSALLSDCTLYHLDFHFDVISKHTRLKAKNLEKL